MKWTGTLLIRVPAICYAVKCEYSSHPNTWFTQHISKQIEQEGKHMFVDESKNVKLSWVEATPTSIERADVDVNIHDPRPLILRDVTHLRWPSSDLWSWAYDLYLHLLCLWFPIYMADGERCFRPQNIISWDTTVMDSCIVLACVLALRFRHCFGLAKSKHVNHVFNIISSKY